MKKYLLVVMIAISMYSFQQRTQAVSIKEEIKLEKRKISPKVFGKRKLVKCILFFLKPIPLILTIIFCGLIHTGIKKGSMSKAIKYFARGVVSTLAKPEMELDYKKYDKKTSRTVAQNLAFAKNEMQGVMQGAINSIL